MNLEQDDLPYFRGECDDLINELTQSVDLLAENPKDSDTINSMFRAIHTLKGNAKIAGSVELENLCSLIEDVLEAFRQGKLEPDQKLLQLANLSIDGLKKMLDELYELKEAESAHPKLVAALQFVAQR
ncbi:Chemotaxis protein CheA [Piscirickettsia salmonis]|uniref:Histidine phosphotransferase n=1 Tax=Piscirickettsia salmonis TaxID=1238 RepID=A0AAC8VGU1_PISSA|nr:Hpt domain-containing protein [Piscirickettsia salmonis]AKP73511.1 histidine phosphotransferase [Piscirickettsia salmonis LF-89 = ATCC VR-1361]ALB22268.1 histidine phosphotransferase [Piscirickettsia salmonis]ALY02367.1 histidine phosphotransferase [Piscirickettsia salmonis]AMA41884.1 histidine phosphotransferase [Piscirickettsia salmonis]AOS34360.1 histidine phosphotransferase [Piscirickettsia salmonis]